MTPWLNAMIPWGYKLADNMADRVARVINGGATCEEILAMRGDVDSSYCSA